MGNLTISYNGRDRMNGQEERVVLISLTNRMGGAEQMLLMMADTLKSPLIFLKKVKRHCLPIKPGQEVTYVTTKPLAIGFVLLLKELFKYRKGYVIISSHAYLNAFLGFLKRVGFIKSKLVVRESTSLFTRFKGFKRLSYKLAYRLGYPSVGLVVCQTGSMRNQFLASNRYLQESRVITLDNSIQLATVRVKGNEPLTDPLTNFPYICSAGRLISLKGFDILIRSFKEIADEYPKVNLLILGEGPERRNLQYLIQQLDLTGRVFLKGHMDNPYPYFKKAKVCVVSSIQEGFPNVLLQMMALNSSIVSTLCAGGIEDIPAIKTVPPNDKKALQIALKTALVEDNTRNEAEIQAYLANRSPEKFISTILEKIA